MSQVDDYKQNAESLFNDHILGLWKTSQNVWRNGCAMDTILDYFTVCEVDASQYKADHRRRFQIRLSLSNL